MDMRYMSLYHYKSPIGINLKHDAFIKNIGSGWSILVEGEGQWEIV